MTQFEIVAAAINIQLFRRRSNDRIESYDATDLSNAKKCPRHYWNTLRTAHPNPPHIRKAAWNALPALVQFCQTEAIEFANEHDGGEAVWHVLNRAEEWIRTRWYDILRYCQQSTSKNNVHQVGQIKSDDVATTTTTTTTSDQTSTQILGRRIIYIHII